MEQNEPQIRLNKPKSILEFIEKNYDIYHHSVPKENMILPLLSQIEQRFETKLSLCEKGKLLYLKSALAMMIDKGSPQLEKDLLKAVVFIRSKQIR